MGLFGRRAIALGLPLGACAPLVRGAGPAVIAPAVADDALIMADGARLPLRVWRPDGAPRGALLALHGLNEHAGTFFDDSAALFTAAGMVVYAYDQRGHGAAPHPGIWPGTATLVADATEAARLIAARHPGLPLTLLGESMGAAVCAVAAAATAPLPASAMVLSSPAVWARSEMPAALRWALWLAAHTVPVVGFQASAGGIAPTDNPAALRRLSEDKLTLKHTRMDAVHGLVDLMDSAVAALPACCAALPTLVLFGGRDRIVPVEVAQRVLRRQAAAARVAYYPEGWHLLLRDLNRDVVAADVLAWRADPAAPLPSGADAAAAGWIAGRPSPAT